MNFDDAFFAVRDAQKTMASADCMLRKVASLLDGRLKSADINPHVLCRLKKELADFNARTLEWKQ